MIVRSLFAASMLLGISLHAAAPPPPPEVLLWPDGAPGALGTADEDKPRYTVYMPANPIGTGVLICPGGGYGGLAMDHEGVQVAHWLNGFGVTAFVLQYRLGPKYHHPIELNDARRAIRMIRLKMGEYAIAADRLGIWGFSAGGHLASTVSTHFDPGILRSPDPAERQSSRPSFAILAYPVITFSEPYAHKGSVRNLLGDTPDPALLADLSNEKKITAGTPPTFLFHTADDSVVPAQNSLMYFEGLLKAGVPAELHVYEHGAHGVGLAPYDPVLSTWPVRLADWLRSHGWLTQR